MSLGEFVAFVGGDKYLRPNSVRSARIFLAPWSGGAGRERGGGGLASEVKMVLFRNKAVMQQFQW